MQASRMMPSLMATMPTCSSDEQTQQLNAVNFGATGARRGGACRRIRLIGRRAASSWAARAKDGRLRMPHLQPRPHARGAGGTSRAARAA